MADKLTILGNGSSALLTAFALSRLGISIDLFCDLSKKNDTNLVTFLSSFTLKYLNSIGIDQLSLQKYENINEIECCYINKNNNDNSVLNFENNKVKPLGRIIPNNDLFDLLYQKVINAENIKIIKEEIIDIDFNDDQSTISLASKKSFNAKLLIFTDSKNRFVKNLTSNKFIKKSFNQTALSIDANVNRSHLNTAYQFFTKDGPLALLPVNNKRSSFVWSLKNESAILDYSKEEIAKEIYKYSEKYVSQLSINSITKHKLMFSFSKNMYFKNVILLGEAAHIVHPIAGQGFNLTLKDISALCDVIDRYSSLGYELNHKFILKEFSITRIPDNTLFSFSTKFMNDAFFSKNNLINKSVETSFKVLNRLPFIKKSLMMTASGRKIF